MDAKVLLDGDGSVSEKGLMERNGYTFKAVECDGVLVPEAWSYKQVMLPHLMGSDMDILFPVAVAARHARDKDYVPEPCGREIRGQEVTGQAGTDAKQKPLGGVGGSEGKPDDQ